MEKQISFRLGKMEKHPSFSVSAMKKQNSFRIMGRQMSFGVDSKKTKDSPGKRGDAMLHLAYRGGNLSKVMEMLQSLGLDALSKQNQEGETPLYVAAENGHSHVVAQFLKHLDLQTASIAATNGYDPFHIAAKQGHLGLLIFKHSMVMLCFEIRSTDELLKALRDTTDSVSGSIVFKIYIVVICIYAGIQLFWSSLAQLPSCHRLFNRCDNSSIVTLVKWIHQEHYYVGRGMYEATTDYILYLLFRLVVLGAKFAFAYYLQIRSLEKPTRLIIDFKDVRYSWHDFVSKNNHNALTVATLWGPVFCIYLLYIYIFYTIISAVVGFLLGARDRLGEIRSLGVVHKLFERFPEAFMDNLHIPLASRDKLRTTGQVLAKDKFDAARFSPFWNEIVNNLREEDYITNLEMELLQMPKNTRTVPMVQWPLFFQMPKNTSCRSLQYLGWPT